MKLRESILMLLMIIVGAFAFATGLFLGQGDARNEAIRHGVAEWVVKEDGTTMFRWKTQPTVILGTNATVTAIHVPTNRCSILMIPKATP